VARKADIRQRSARIAPNILKGVSATELKAALWAVYKNETSFVSPEFATRLLSAAQAKKPTKVDSGLSHREMQILLVVAEKLSVMRKMGAKSKRVAP
jgi:DNA-binding NarL/FixJ family response regulator